MSATSNLFEVGDLVIYAEDDRPDESPAEVYRRAYRDSGIPVRALLVVTGVYMGAISVACRLNEQRHGTELTRGPKHAGGYLLGTLWDASLFRFALLPCPFCGSTNVVVAKRNLHNDYKVVWCRGCSAVEVGAGTPVAEHAIRLWNRRTN